MKISNADEYQIALTRANELVPRDPPSQTPEGQELNDLILAMSFYERDNFTIAVHKWGEHYHTLTRAEQDHIKGCIENGHPVPVFDKFVAGFASLAEVSPDEKAVHCVSSGDCTGGGIAGVQS